MDQVITRVFMAGAKAIEFVPWFGMAEIQCVITMSDGIRFCANSTTASQALLRAANQIPDYYMRKKDDAQGSR